MVPYDWVREMCFHNDQRSHRNRPGAHYNAANVIAPSRAFTSNTYRWLSRSYTPVVAAIVPSVLSGPIKPSLTL